MQKKAYDMRISDWSSDVCSSDLVILRIGVRDRRLAEQPVLDEVRLLHVDQQRPQPAQRRRHRDIGGQDRRLVDRADREDRDGGGRPPVRQAERGQPRLSVARLTRQRSEGRLVRKGCVSTVNAQVSVYVSQT